LEQTSKKRIHLPHQVTVDFKRTSKISEPASGPDIRGKIPSVVGISRKTAALWEDLTENLI
jgi:hypothetical protein